MGFHEKHIVSLSADSLHPVVFTSGLGYLRSHCFVYLFIFLRAFAVFVWSNCVVIFCKCLYQDLFCSPSYKCQWCSSFSLWYSCLRDGGFTHSCQELSVAFPAGSSYSGNRGAGGEAGGVNEKTRGSLQKLMAAPWYIYRSGWCSAVHLDTVMRSVKCWLDGIWATTTFSGEGSLFSMGKLTWLLFSIEDRHHKTMLLPLILL